MDACSVLCSDIQSRGGRVFATPRTVAYQPPLSMGFFQARILEWAAISFSRGSSLLKDWTRVSCIGRRILYHWDTWEAEGWMGDAFSELCHLSEPSFKKSVKWDLWLPRVRRVEEGRTGSLGLADEISLYIEWIKSEVLQYGTGKLIQYLGINQNGKE